MKSLSLLLLTLAIAGCAGHSLPNISSDRALSFSTTETGRYVYVSDRTQNELIVYSMGNPSPIRRRPLTEAGGVATDAHGNVYVANGSGGNVLEFNSGATRLIRTFSQGLHHPRNVVIGPDGGIYIADDATPNASAVVAVVATGTRVIPTPHGYPAHGIAVDDRGDLFVEVSGNGDSWPLNVQCMAVNEIYEFTPHALVPLHSILMGEQNWGLAVQNGALYSSDLCMGILAQFAAPGFGSMTVLGAHLSTPMYLTIHDGTAVIPDAGNGFDGNVRLQQLPPGASTEVITDGLKGPVGAAIGS